LLLWFVAWWLELAFPEFHCLLGVSMVLLRRWRWLRRWRRGAILHRLLTTTRRLECGDSIAVQHPGRLQLLLPLELLDCLLCFGSHETVLWQGCS
jgi:hypothetical protein